MADKVLNMIWANEAGVSVYIYEGEHDRRVIEIHGVVNDYEIVMATATIEKHNRNRVVDAFVPASTEEFQHRFNLSDKDMEDLKNAGPIVQSAAPALVPKPRPALDDLRETARQIIDIVFASPCVVETRCFSQPQELEQLENRIVTLIDDRSAGHSGCHSATAPAPVPQSPHVCVRCGHIANLAVDGICERPISAFANCGCRCTFPVAE